LRWSNETLSETPATRTVVKKSSPNRCRNHRGHGGSSRAVSKGSLGFRQRL
jgi:hypothetical protein